MSDQHKYFTAIYRDVTPGDEARAIGEHPKWIAGGWTNIMHERDEAQAALAAAREERDALRAENEALKKDAERLTWCERNLKALNQDVAELYCVTYIDADGFEQRTGRFSTLREAIDAAAIAGRAGEKA